MLNRRTLLGSAAGLAGAALLEGSGAVARAADEKPLRVLCWSERTEPAAVYPNGGNAVVAEFLNQHPGIHAEVASLNDPDQGLSQERLENIDVLTWWGHQKHALVDDGLVKRVVARINEGKLGFVALHSSHYSKILKTALNTSGNLGMGKPGSEQVGRDGGTETVYVIDQLHPVAKGVSDFVIPKEEFYNEPFGIPEPHALVFFSVFGAKGPNGELRKFRSGCAWNVGQGRFFYFRPGHEEYPTYHNENVQKVVTNAVMWVGRQS